MKSVMLNKLEGPIRELNITVFVNNQVKIERLIPYSIEIDENYPNETHVLPGNVVSALKTSCLMLVCSRYLSPPIS